MQKIFAISKISIGRKFHQKFRLDFPTNVIFEFTATMNKPTSFSTLILAGAIMASTFSASDAAVTIVRQGATNTWDIIFDPITFVANANAGELDWLVFQDFFASNASESGVSTSSVRIAIAGNPATDYPVNNANGVFNSSLGGLNQNDLLINFAATAINPTNGQSAVVSMAPGGFQFTAASVPAITSAPIVNVFILSNATPDRLV